MINHNSLTDIPGIRVGHAQNEDALTGCTVVLCEAGAVAGVDQRGGAPGTRETDALRPMHLVQQVHAIVLAGGSAYGLDAAGGVMRYLEERGVGFDVGVARVPIVPAAILFDLSIGGAGIRPDAAMGYAACEAATSGPVPEGNVGAGCGATVGKVLGMSLAMKAGIGSASQRIGSLMIGALVAVNALGDVIDPNTGKILAGVHRSEEPDRMSQDGSLASPFLNTLAVMKEAGERGDGSSPQPGSTGGNTVIGVIGTNARLDKDGANMVAQMAQDGLARTIRPAHTLYDGDTIFALATGEVPIDDITLVGAFAAEVMAQAVVRAVLSAGPAAGLPSASSLTIP